ncbi:MAG: DUF58 domain-containing protein [Pseudomonadota bacterium]|nr:DUF58 domain-containing protein [Pseudomonadota bacterium]
MPFQEFSQGTEIRAERLAGLRVLANLMPLHRQRRILNDQAGAHTSRLRGRGIDFSEVREYQPGDDIRSMDWRVTARTGDAHIKVFREERERPVIVACDLRASMNFGTRRALKRVVAADLAALIAWSAAAHGDRVGGLVFNDEIERDLRPHTGRKTLMAFLHQLASVPVSAHQPGRERMQQVCRHLARIARPGSAVYLISDFQGFDRDCEQILLAVARHCDLIMVHISDPFESQPPVGEFAVTNGQQTQPWRLTPSAAQARQHAFQQQLDALHQHCRHLRASLVPVSTAYDPLDQMRQGLGLNDRAATPKSSSGSGAQA